MFILQLAGYLLLVIINTVMWDIKAKYLGAVLGGFMLVYAMYP